MKKILLTQGKTTLVDDEDYERLSKYKWCAQKNFRSNVWYAARQISTGNGKQKTITMHREIMNATKGRQIDHRNGNGLDNRKENLRFCTHQQNMFNRITPLKNNKLSIKGVRWREDMKKFQAQIKFNRRVINLGFFTVLADADQAYRVAEIKYFREFAREETKKLYFMV